MRTDDEEFARPARPPDTTSWSAVREAAKDCEACHLYKRATQTVFGEGPKGAVMMLVGEQPGDYEDVAGKPFVGPAGKIMDQALEEAGIDRSKVYVTNAVKHFKWEPRGKRRIHQKPNSREIAACRPWLEAELRIVKPKLGRGNGRDGGADDFRPSISGHARARQSVVIKACAEGPRDRSSMAPPSAARRSIARARIQALRQRSSCCVARNWRRIKGSRLPCLCDRCCVSRFVFRDERPAKLIERLAFYFSARSIH